MTLLSGLLASALIPALAWGFPSTMDIGAFAIDNYSGNGSGAPNLSFQISSGQNLFAGANAVIPGYSLAFAAPGAGTSGPNLALDARDTQVSKAAITSTSSGYGNREYCDFLFYGGHGLVGGMFLGLNAGYGNVAAGEMNLGVGYNRWLLANGCSLFNGATPPATVWQPAFKGLKALLSFKSLVYDNNLSWDLYHDFWTNWTYRDKSLLNSFFDAQTNYGYKHFYPSKGLEPGCLSAQVPAFTVDYCRESFKWVAHNYTPATANTGSYYYRKIGSPEY